jgi:ATP-binding cassette subfamily C (CFTR/MRP) protein 1
MQKQDSSEKVQIHQEQADTEQESAPLNTEQQNPSEENQTPQNPEEPMKDPKKPTKIKKEKEDKRPMANKLEGYPEAQKLFNKVHNQPHPVDQFGCLRNFMVAYLNPYLKLAKEAILTQECHFNMPEKEEVFRTTDDIGIQMYGKGKQDRARFQKRDPKLPDEDSGAAFKMRPVIKRNIIWSFVKAYPFDVFYLAFLMAFNAVLQFVTVYCMNAALEEISKQNEHSGTLTDKTIILIYFLVILAVGIFSNLLLNWLWLTRVRVMLRLIGALHGLIFEKVLRIGVVNPHEHDEGSIINYIQSDVYKFYSTMWALSSLITAVINLSLCIGMGVYYFGNAFYVMIVGLIVLGLGNKYFTSLGLRKSREFSSATDVRLNAMKNILKNVKFIKLNGMENIFFQKLSVKRATEISKMIQSNLAWAVINTIFIAGTATVIIVFLYFFIRSGDQLTVAKATIMLRIFDLLKRSLWQIPGGISILANLTVSVRRINLFLESKELDSNRVMQEPNPESENAVEIRKGSFYWDKKMSKEEAEEIRKNKMKSEKQLEKERKKKAKKEKKEKKKNASPAKSRRDTMTSTASSGLRKSLLSTYTTDSMKEKMGNKAEQKAKEFTLRDINFKAQKGKLTTIIGKIGSGKSSILYSILGEMRILDYVNTEVCVNGSTCFLGQNPWLINGTVKENILLHKEFDQDKFDWAIKYSALDIDLKNWEKKELHKIGDDGAALSGGQRARVALARCLYQDPDIYIFDDIMSALDAKVGAFITEETIMKQLKGKTVILVTHGLQYLKYSDYIYVMEKGEVALEGGFEEVSGTELYLKFLELDEWSKETKKDIDEKVQKEKKDKEDKLQKETENVDEEANAEINEASSVYELKQTAEEKEMSKRYSVTSQSVKSKLLTGEDKVTEKLIEEFGSEEDRSVGNISCSVIHNYVISFGGYFVILIFIGMYFMQNGVTMFSNKFLEDWSHEFEKHDKYAYLKDYTYIWVVASVLGMLIRLVVLIVNYTLSTRMHSKMMFSLLHAKIEKFLDKVPYGQIQNRFSQDINNIDRQSINYFNWFMEGITNAIVVLVTLGYSVGYEVAIFIVIWLIYILMIEKKYMNAKREYNRLMAISSSPVINTCSDTIKGLAYVRAMGLRQWFRDKFLKKVTEKMKNELIDTVFIAWFSNQCNISQQLIIQLPAMLGILYYFGNIHPAQAGLFLVCLFAMTESLEQTVILKTEWESSLISIERCVFFTKLEPEPGYRTVEKEREMFALSAKLKKLKNYEQQKDKEEVERRKEIRENGRVSKKKRILQSVVEKGEVVFENVSAKYLTSTEYVLKNLNFRIDPGEKIGVVGRTGSGKSTLIKLLWNYLTPQLGKIKIDGKDISKVDIKALRSQMTIITQETSLFEGTLRDNLDPSGFRFDDEKLTGVMTQLGFDHQVYKKEGLEMNIDSEGTNLSQGEKQLVCFARSILRPSNLILLDEATASIDLKTEESIQKAIETEFKECTMLIVAHRVQTVMECDKILVMKDGEVEDYDSPENLMKKGGFFKDIVDKMQAQ